MSAYDAYYILKVKKEVEPGWYSFKWKPLWRKTFSVYVSKEYHWHFGFSCRFGHDNGAHNGWGRSYDRVDTSISLGRISISFWILYNFICMAEGPMDTANKRPIDISNLK